jgi:hypothetical protein
MRRAHIYILLPLLLGALTTIAVAAALFARARDPATRFGVAEINPPREADSLGNMHIVGTTGVTSWAISLWYRGPEDASPVKAANAVMAAWEFKPDTSTSHALAAYIRTFEANRRNEWLTRWVPPSCTIHLTDVGWPMPALTGWFLHGHERALPNVARAQGSIRVEVPKPERDMGQFHGWQPRFHAFPITPMWAGFAINTLVFAAAWWVLLFGYFTARRLSRGLKGLCIACGYPREGLPANAPCPECGRAASVPPASIPTAAAAETPP